MSVDGDLNHTTVASIEQLSIQLVQQLNLAITQYYALPPYILSVTIQYHQ